jgi:hypothetical protein
MEKITNDYMLCYMARKVCKNIHEENKSPLMLVREILLEYKTWFER